MDSSWTFEYVFNAAAQVLIPTLTLGGMFLISIKHPAEGLLLNFLAQPFWLYSTHRAWKKEGQIGMLINTIAFTAISGFGVVNYFILS